MKSEPLVFVGHRVGTPPVYSVPLSKIPVVDEPKQSKDIPDRPNKQFVSDHKGDGEAYLRDANP